MDEAEVFRSLSSELRQWTEKNIVREEVSPQMLTAVISNEAASMLAAFEPSVAVRMLDALVRDFGDKLAHAWPDVGVEVKSGTIDPDEAPAPSLQ